MAKTDANEKELTLKGCYGEHVHYEQLSDFLADAFQSNRDAEEAGSDERFATCIWGHSGCVLGDTEVEVRKIRDDGCHKIIVVNPKPDSPQM